MPNDSAYGAAHRAQARASKATPTATPTPGETPTTRGGVATLVPAGTHGEGAMGQGQNRSAVTHGIAGIALNDRHGARRATAIVDEGDLATPRQSLLYRCLILVWQ